MKNCVRKATKGVKASNQEKVKEKGNKKGDGTRKKERLPVKWWDEECEKVTSDRKHRLKVFRKENDIESFIEYKKTL